MHAAKPFVVAFNRDRDFYQVPLALYENDLLDCLITDIYCPDQILIRRFFKALGLSHRKIDGLPSFTVRSNFNALLWQIIGSRLKLSKSRIFEKVDSALSRAALRRACKSNANLFLYSHYAFEAFSSPQAKDKIKGLFKFHPDAKLIREILLEDFANHPECSWSLENELETSEGNDQSQRLEEESKMADFIICASSFTARSLRHAGISKNKISILPYGIDTQQYAFNPNYKIGSDCRFLFVGQGVQRKGLHHLLKAWRRIKLPRAELTVVTSFCDPAIRAMASAGVKIVPRQSMASLGQYYNNSHVFVMPSLVEGFGLVYLEALASGCYCIGTENTGLPDLQPCTSIAEIVPVGDITALAESLEKAYILQQKNQLDSLAVRRHAETLSWQSFRKSLAAIMQLHV